jgi:hypothetical protein
MQWFFLLRVARNNLAFLPDMQKWKHVPERTLYIMIRSAACESSFL